VSCFVACVVDLNWTDGASYPISSTLEIDSLEAPVALCSRTGNVGTASPMATSLLKRLSILDRVPAPLPVELWRLLERTPAGEAVEWRPPRARASVLGCTRYAAAGGAYVLLMREVSDKHHLLSERLHRQRLESTGQLVASIAHDIRSSVASIVYSADFLEASGNAVTPDRLAETLHDIGAASRCLQLTVDGLLDYARLGPSISVPVSVRGVLSRAQGLLRSYYRDGAHRVRVDVAPEAEWVRGNPIIIEQIFVNLLVNAAEAAPSPRSVVVTAFPVETTFSHSESANRICIRVWDDGPGVPRSVRDLVFQPFFTTKEHGSGLGLTIAREAAENLEGELVLGDGDQGACFTLYLPRSEAPP
jgi:signal transduction histidine kinase